MEKSLASLLDLLPKVQVLGSTEKVITDVTADSRTDRCRQAVCSLL